MESVSREARELKSAGRPDDAPRPKRASGPDESKPQVRSLEVADDASPPALSEEGAEILQSLTDKQRFELEDLLNKLRQTLERGGDPAAVMAELKGLAEQAEQGQWPENFSGWLNEKIQGLEAAVANSTTEAHSAESATLAVSGFLTAVTRAVRSSADRGADKPPTSAPLMAAGALPAGALEAKPEGQSPTDLLSRLQAMLKDNGQARGAGENALMAGQNGLDKNLEDGKLLGVVKLASSLAASSGIEQQAKADSVSASSLTALAEAAGQQRATPSSVTPGKAQPMQTSVLTGFNQPGWSDSVGQKVLWLARQNISSAELRLDPPDLGPVNVRVSVQNDQAQVTFTSQHLVVREALDQSANRLRDMFASQGIDLVDVDVSDQSGSQPESTLADGQSRGNGGGGNDPEALADGDAETSQASADRVVEGTISLVDDYA